MVRLYGHELDLLSFDLDDTLLDTETSAYLRFESAVATLQMVKPDTDEAVIETAVARALRTHPFEGRVVNFLSDVGLEPGPELELVRAAYYERMNDSLTPLGNAFEVLAELRRRVPLALVTNGPSPLQRSKIAHFEVASMVDWIVISGEVGSEKPDRAIFEHLSELAGVPLPRIAHIGDSLTSDIAGARGSGALAIWVNHQLLPQRVRPSDARPHYTVRHISELLANIE